MLWVLPLLVRCALADELLKPVVVVMSAMPSEMARFAERLPLGERIPFPVGSSELLYNDSLKVAGLILGEGVRKASISVTALGLDPRFDVSESFWMFAGIAGIDPSFGSVGSAVWAETLVHAEEGYLFNEGALPEDWIFPVVPTVRTKPFEDPAPDPTSEAMVFHLPMTAYAYNLTKDIVLEDTPNLEKARSEFEPHSPAAQPPSVRVGATVSGDFFWAGRYWTDFYRRWFRYWVNDDQDDNHASFATTAMEDTAIATALNGLDKAGRATKDRLLILRTASDYSYQPPGADLVDWVFSDSHMSPEDEAFEAAWLTGSPVIFDLLKNFSSPPPVSPPLHEREPVLVEDHHLASKSK